MRGDLVGQVENWLICLSVVLIIGSLFAVGLRRFGLSFFKFERLAVKRFFDKQKGHQASNRMKMAVVADHEMPLLDDLVGRFVWFISITP